MFQSYGKMLPAISLCLILIIHSLPLVQLNPRAMKRDLKPAKGGENLNTKGGGGGTGNQGTGGICQGAELVVGVALMEGMSYVFASKESTFHVYLVPSSQISSDKGIDLRGLHPQAVDQVFQGAPATGNVVSVSKVSGKPESMNSETVMITYDSGTQGGGEVRDQRGWQDSPFAN